MRLRSKPSLASTGRSSKLFAHRAAPRRPPGAGLGAAVLAAADGHRVVVAALAPVVGRGHGVVGEVRGSRRCGTSRCVLYFLNSFGANQRLLIHFSISSLRGCRRRPGTAARRRPGAARGVVDVVALDRAWRSTGSGSRSGCRRRWCGHRSSGRRPPSRSAIDAAPFGRPLRSAVDGARRGGPARATSTLVLDDVLDVAAVRALQLLARRCRTPARRRMRARIGAGVLGAGGSAPELGLAIVVRSDAVVVDLGRSERWRRVVRPPARAAAAGRRTRPGGGGGAGPRRWRLVGGGGGVVPSVAPRAGSGRSARTAAAAVASPSVGGIGGGAANSGASSGTVLGGRPTGHAVGPHQGRPRSPGRLACRPASAPCCTGRRRWPLMLDVVQRLAGQRRRTAAGRPAAAARLARLAMPPTGWPSGRPWRCPCPSAWRRP